MPTDLLATGVKANNLEAAILSRIRRSGSSALGLAIAYVSIYGAHFLKGVVGRFDLNVVRLITDTGDAITHPQALRLALAEGWNTRVVNLQAGTFHSKIVIGGRQFGPEDLMEKTALLLIGSANLTKGGLRGNVECSLIRTDDAAMPAAASVFRKLWTFGEELTGEAVDAYEIEFAERNRTRSAKDLETLGVADEVPVEDSTELKKRRPSQNEERSIATAAAAAAWTGLESFTGEYRFQIEFPRDAGEVLKRMLGHIGVESVGVLCEDGIVRNMRYRYYEDNAMYRLNVPNDTPGVTWARENHAGVAMVEAHQGEDAPLRFRIIRPGKDMREVMGRSVALGTWGKTTTRLYGWF
jgi:PLD-like domain